MLYFEDARLEFLGVPMAYFPYMSAPDPTVKRKTGVLTPSYSTSSVYGLGVSVPYYWALAPDYDFDLHADDHEPGKVRCCRASGVNGCSMGPTASAPPVCSSSTRTCFVN